MHRLILGIILSTLVITGAVFVSTKPVDSQERMNLESITPYFQTRTVNLRDGMLHDIHPVELIKRGNNEALRFFVESRDAEFRIIFRDYIQVWGLDVGDPAETSDEVKTIIYQTVKSVTRNGPFVPENPGTISVFLSLASDGRISSRDFTYTDAQACTGATCLAETTPIEPGGAVWWGIAGPPDEYLLVTSYHVFDTSPIQDSHIITNVDLEFFKSAGSSHLNSDDLAGIVVEIRGYPWGPTLTVDDWIDFTDASNWTNLEFLGYFDAPEEGTSVVTMPVTTSSTFLEYIDKSGITEIVMAHNAAYTTNAPIPGQDIFLTRWATGSNINQSLRPRLTVTHTFMPPTPTPTPAPTPTVGIIQVEFISDGQPVNLGLIAYGIAFALGIAFVVIGEWKKNPMYLGIGAVLIVASAIATGITWVILLSGIAFLAIGGQMVYQAWSEHRKRELE